MTTESGSGTPKSPEVQEPYVREELDQDMVTHQGQYRKPQTGPFRPEMRGQRIYAGLYDHVKSIAASDPRVRGIRLYVDRRNTAAQEVYRRMGMNGEHYLVFEWMK